MPDVPAPDPPLPDVTEAEPPHPPRSVPSSRRRRVLVAVAVAVVLVVAAELAVRWVEPAMPRGAGWPDVATATKVEQLDQLAERACTDVVFVGNSMTRDDLVPEVFTTADPTDRSAYNASLDAASPEILRRWVLDEVVPATRPALVVIGVASFDLNDEAATAAAARRSWESAPYTAPGLGGDLEAFFTRNLALVRNRSSLRDPTTVLDAVTDRLDGRRAARPAARGIPGVLAADGHGLSRRDLEYRGETTTITRLQQQFLRPFEVGGEQAGELRRLVTDLDSTGTDVAVLVLPVTDDYVHAHPEGAADVAAFRAALRDALAGTRSAILEAPQLGDGRFADTHHLDGGGADELSADLPSLLDAAGITARGCGAA